MKKKTSNAEKILQNIEKLKRNGAILSPQNLQREIIVIINIPKKFPYLYCLSVTCPVKVLFVFCVMVTRELVQSGPGRQIRGQLNLLQFCSCCIYNLNLLPSRKRDGRFRA